MEPEDVKPDGLYFVRLEGPRGGGSGHFPAYGRELEERTAGLGEPYRIERFVDGVYIYVHFFYSPILNRLELFGVDERLIVADANKRRPFKVLPYTIAGNKPVALRESLLPELYDHGLAFVDACGNSSHRASSDPSPSTSPTTGSSTAWASPRA